MSPSINTAADRVAKAYDEVPYPGRAYQQTHPDRLATMATLFGMQPAPVERCRVLEIGCGDGANLIGMAFSLPESSFTGFDVSACAIEKGRRTVDALSLANIKLDRLDLRDVEPGFGEFDYIIAHGMYSWLPSELREKILGIAQETLTANGVAYVSYNTYPGGHLRTLCREMMLFHNAAGSSGPLARVEEGLELLRLVCDSRRKLNSRQSEESESPSTRHKLAGGSFAAHDDPYTAFVLAEVERLRERCSSDVFHDEFAPVYQPFYFHEFAANAGRHGLQFLAEANLHDMWIAGLSPEVSALLGRFPADIIRREQYMDFFRFRCFRQTLLCHEGVQLDREVKPDAMRSFRVASCVRSTNPNPDLLSEAAEQFSGPRSSSVVTAHPLAKSALWRLSGCWPDSLAFSELLESACSLCGRSADERAAAELSEIVLRTCAAGLTELHTYRPRLMVQGGERPVASPLVRLELEHQTGVTTLLHTNIRISGLLERRLILLLDGTRDRAALLRELSDFVQSPDAFGELADSPIEITPEDLERGLADLARLGLLLQ
jgi:methyltransferase-like protein